MRHDADGRPRIIERFSLVDLHLLHTLRRAAALIGASTVVSDCSRSNISGS